MNSSHENPDGAPAPRTGYPPVEPPATTFIFQLFLIPLLIVTIIVVVWLLFSWLANMGNDPQELVRDLQRLDRGSWRKAYALTNQLRDPEHDELKDNSALCRDLAAILASENKSLSTGRERTKLRVFLCRALGEFRVADGIPPLVEAAARERNDADVDVRRAALEAMSVLSGNLGPQVIRDDPQAMDVILAASRASDGEDGGVQRAMLRSTAAFVLGVIGGSASSARLVSMLDDSFPNARYNAAIGLARHGHSEAAPVLLEMLDPQNARGWEGEKSDSAREFKRALVLTNGIRAAVELLNKSAGRETAAARNLLAAIGRLADDETVPRRVRLDARAARQKQPAQNDTVEL